MVGQHKMTQQSVSMCKAGIKCCSPKLLSASQDGQNANAGIFSGNGEFSLEFAAKATLQILHSNCFRQWIVNTHRVVVVGRLVHPG